MSIRIAINGYGRIGRQVLRAIYENNLRSEFEVVAVNASGDLATNAHLTQFDTVHGRFNAQISHDEKNLVVNGDVIPFFSTRNPAELPWGELKVDLVLECTGAFTSKEKCQAHITAGAKKVLISAPGGDDVDATIVYGVNHKDFDPKKDKVISNASCTTNCFVPMVKVLDDAFGVEHGLMTTTHGYTGDQSMVDGPHSDPRRARAGAVNIIPTSTGAARATGLVLSALDGKLDGKIAHATPPDQVAAEIRKRLTKP